MSSTPKRRLKVTVNNRTYLVEVGDLFESPVTVKVNGKSYSVEVTAGEVSQISAGKTAAALETVACHPIPMRKTLPRPVSAGKRVKEVRAPIPGHIVDILVKPGDRVNAGQVLCLLEAMKMKNPIRAHCDGVIANVAVNIGQSVAQSEILLTFTE